MLSTQGLAETVLIVDADHQDVCLFNSFLGLMKPSASGSEYRSNGSMTGGTTRQIYRTLCCLARSQGSG